MTVSAATVDANKHRRGHTNPIKCSNCGRRVPKDKVVKRCPCEIPHNKKSCVREPPQRFRRKEDMENQDQHTIVPAARK
ncbi:hypothetical protein GOP47_0003774 [Adiantum capillus-veneris]|uniref:40S ribosomal protein S26 n=1 Tax=Adiantum capillus-veneris TaxID=13818 RepID=A0A9D4ZP44_ADICA|nr:hypothetical protein GOP47_0003774 [Adiantum capillus-veneris]